MKKFYKEKQKSIEVVKFGDIEISNKAEIAENLNNFYIDSITDIIQKIPPSNNVDFIQLIERIPVQFKFKSVDTLKIKNFLQNNTSKCSTDKVSGKMLLDSMENKNFADFFLNH